MRRNALSTAIALTIIVLACAGCAEAGAQPVSQSAGAPPTAAISATPRTLTWKNPSSKAKRGAPAKITPKHPAKSAEELLADAVGPLVADDNHDVAVAIDDLSSGKFASYAGSQEFVTASIVKADILSTRLYQSQQEGEGLSSGEEALATRMIEDSDNDAATALYNDDGGDSGVDAANKVFGLTETTAGSGDYWGVTTTTVDDQIRLLRLIFTTPSVLSPESQEYIQGLMGQVEPDQAWGVPAAADSGTSYDVKNGWLPRPEWGGLWEVNSIGSVTHDGQHMLIAVLSSYDHDYASGISVVEDIAKKAADALAGS
jgi:hypothetical protein